MKDGAAPDPRSTPWRTIFVLVGVGVVVLLGVMEFLAEREGRSRLARTIAMVMPTRAVAEGGQAPGWPTYRDHVERALDAGDVSRALRAWHDGYGHALASRQWEPMAEMGDLYVRIGRASNGLYSARPTVRRAYLTALVRARRDQSVDGVLRVAEGFMNLGDEEMSRLCLVLAGQIEHGGLRAPPKPPTRSPAPG